MFANATYQYVRKGQPLFTIYSPDVVSTEQEYLLAKQNQKSFQDDMHGTARKEGDWLLAPQNCGQPQDIPIPCPFGDEKPNRPMSAPLSEGKKRMFIELMPLIENRPLTITVSALSEGRIRVNVVPQALAKDSKANEKIGYANKDKIAQIPESVIHTLTTPLSLTGTPTEIDAELAQQLKALVDSHLALQQSVDEAKQQIAEAVKAIEERDKARSKSRTARPRQTIKAQTKRTTKRAHGGQSVPRLLPRASTGRSANVRLART